jgi:hypothetical protein
MGAKDHSVFGDGYPPRAGDLTRYADEPLDQRIATLVHSAAAEDLDAWNALRARLSTDDHDSLMLFADRQSVLALRTGRSVFATLAIEALALLAADRVDYRDLDVDLSLYALQATHGDETEAIAFALSRAHPDMRRLFKRRAGHRLSLNDCGWYSFQTRHGLGFLKTWNPIPQDPSLLVAAVAIADRIDAWGGYAGTSIHLGTLGWVWFRRPPVPPARRLDELPTKGCVSVTSDHRAGDWKHSVHVLLADVEDEATARVLVDLARGASGPKSLRQAASRAARLFVVNFNATTGDGTPENVAERLADLTGDLAGAAFSTPVIA